MSNPEGKKTKKFRSLTFALAIAFLAVSAVVLVVSGILNIYFNLQTQQKFIDSNQEFIAQAAAEAVKNFVTDKFGKLENGVRIGDLASADQEEQQIVLEKLIGIEPAFRQLVLLNAQGQELLKVSRLSSFVTSQLTERAGSDMFLNARQGKTYTGQVYIDEVTSEPMMVIAVPVTNIFGDFKGILMAELNLKFMWNLVDRLKIGDTGVAYVVDLNGNLIAFGDISRVLKGENLIYLGEVSKFAEENESIHVSRVEISKGIRGNYVTTTHVHLSSPNWAIVVELPIPEAYESMIMQLMLSLVTLALSFAFAVFVGIYISKRITKPIIKLRDVAAEIGKGNLDTKIEIKSKDEIGELASSFIQMTADLKKSKSKIKEYTVNLEKQIEKRTKELQSKVDELEVFQKVTVGRELKMVELKKKIKELESKK